MIYKIMLRGIERDRASSQKQARKKMYKHRNILGICKFGWADYIIRTRDPTNPKDTKKQIRIWLADEINRM
tara:strand:- start:265 stop:477 length:213 start_codon:yes stop_codon:yes gene_type:complete